MSKSQLRERCVHRHTVIEHPKCFDIMKGERVGYLDIETNNLVASHGIMLTYCIKVAGEDKIYSGVIEKKDVLGDTLDKNLVKQLLKDLENFDRIITWYGAGFDVPFIRTRALIHFLKFPFFGTYFHTDAYFIAKKKLKLNSNRLENACRIILGTTNKTYLDYVHWLRGSQGNKKSLAYILEHNRYDVIDLERMYLRLMDYQKITKTSI